MNNSLDSSRGAVMRSIPAKTIVLGALLCFLFVGATVAIVRTIRSEAEKTRQAMQQSAESLASDGVRDAVHAAINPDEEDIDHTVRRMEDAAHRLLGSIANGPGNDASDDPRKPSAAPISTDESEPTILIEAMFRSGQALSEDLDRIGQDLLQLDESEEIQIGTILHQRLKADSQVVTDSDLTEKLRTLAAPFLEVRQRPGIPYTFVVLQDDNINAFSHLGGYIYVHTGLINFVKSDAELQFVLGHEIAHMDLRHCAEQTTYAARASQAAGDFGGSMVQIAYHAIALGYSEEKEFEADTWSYRQMKNGRSPVFAFLERLEDVEKTQMPLDMPKSAPKGSAMEVVLGHFRSHPPTSDRKKRLEMLKQEVSPH